MNEERLEWLKCLGMILEAKRSVSRIENEVPWGFQQMISSESGSETISQIV